MNAQSPSAYAVSLTLHGVFIAVLLFSAWTFRSGESKTTIMELVAGAGDNYGATEAPALGDPDSGNPASPEAAPEQQTFQAVAAPPDRPAQPAIPKIPDFSKRLDRVADRVEARQMKKIEQQRAREEAERAKREAAAKAKQAKEEAAAAKNPRMTKEEFDRLYGGKLKQQKAGTPGPIKTAKIDAKGIREGVAGGTRTDGKGGAGGTALSREEGDMLDAYFSLLIQRLREAHQRPEGVSDLLNATAEFYIARDGSISRVSIVRSSGNAQFDQSVLSAFRNAGTIGPRPDGGGTLRREVTFRMRDE